MKIALLTDGIWPNVIGGMQKHSYYLCKYLARNEVYIDLYHTSKGSTIDLSHFSQGEQKFINSIFVEYPDVSKFPGHYLFASYLYSKSIWEKFKERQEVDLIYAKGLTSWYFMHNKKQIHVPICINIHGYEMFQPTIGILSMLKQEMLKPVFFFINRRADYIFSYGGKITSIIQSLNISENKIIEIPTGIKQEWIYKNNNTVTEVIKFLFVGRYELRKGLTELSEVLKEIENKISNFEFHFIGFIPENKKIVSDKIIYHGEIKDEDFIMKIMRKTDVFVLPSYSEGMPNVILEAMASGCAVIATDVGAVNLLINDMNGWLIAPRSKTELKNVLLEICNTDKFLLKQKKKQSVERISTYFLWDKIIEKTISTFKSLSGRNKNLED